MKSVPKPVSGATKTWGSSTDMERIFAEHPVNVGVDFNQLQWEGMKPFGDLDVYITGDTFSACNRSVSLLGWSESGLLTTERVLGKYFGLETWLSGIALENEWREKPKSKL